MSFELKNSDIDKKTKEQAIANGEVSAPLTSCQTPTTWYSKIFLTSVKCRVEFFLAAFFGERLPCASPF
jgi:hypothetical protein